MIKNGRRGSITTYLTVKGKQGHIAYPSEALNPATPIIKILDELKSKSLDKGNKNFQPSNLEITKIHIDNEVDNVIPAKASATFNIRYNNLHTFNSLKKRILKTIKKIEKDTDRDNFLNAPDAIKYGIVDSILKKRDAVNVKWV